MINKQLFDGSSFGIKSLRFQNFKFVHIEFVTPALLPQLNLLVSFTNSNSAMKVKQVTKYKRGTRLLWELTKCIYKDIYEIRGLREPMKSGI